MSAARFLAALFALLVGQNACAQTLKEAIEQTLKTNPDMQIEVARRASTDQALSQAKGGYYPKIDLAIGNGKELKDNATVESTYGGAIKQKKLERSLTLTQMLFDGFATVSEVTRNQSRLESADHKVAATGEQIALRAIETYLEVLRLGEALALTQENVQIHQKTLDQIKLRVSGGMARKSDLDQIEARLALAGSNLTNAEANLEVAQINYKLVVGAMPKSLVRPKLPGDEFIPSTPDEAAIFALENSRFLKSAVADVAAARAQNQAAKAGLYPRFDLEVGRTDTFTSNSFDAQKDLTTYAMVRMRYNLFRGGGDAARMGETRYQANEAQSVKVRAERQIEQSVRLAWSAHRAARDRLPNLQKHADSTRLTREAYQKQFSMGQRTLLDLLDTENEYFTATSNNINGYYVEMFSRFRLLSELGQLLETIGVSPDVAKVEMEAGLASPVEAKPQMPKGFSVIVPDAKEATQENSTSSVSKLPATPPEPVVQITPVPPTPRVENDVQAPEQLTAPQDPPVAELPSADNPPAPPSALPNPVDQSQVLVEPPTPGTQLGLTPPTIATPEPNASALTVPPPAADAEFMEAPPELIIDSTKAAPAPSLAPQATPQVAEPAVVTPPAAEPPTVAPSVVEPPIVVPSVVEQPLVAPPATEPPVVAPPAAEPPVVSPPVVEPPVVAPPVVEQPLVAPPVAEPPVAAPPVVEPPIAAAPVVDSPLVAPPVAEPPAVAPAVVEPPVVAPPAVEPPVVALPAVEPPVVASSALEPPVVTPPVIEPPVVAPPVVQPPVVAPPVVEPPVASPPVIEPPVDAPPVIEPPVVAPPVVEQPANVQKPSADFMDAPTELVFSAAESATTPPPQLTAEAPIVAGPSSLKPEATPPSDDFMDAPPDMLPNAPAAVPSTTVTEPIRLTNLAPATKPKFESLKAENALGQAPADKQQSEGVDWTGDEFWLIEFNSLFDLRGLSSVWKDLQTRYAAQLDNKTMLPRRQTQGEIQEGNKPMFKLFVARFSSRAAAESLCAAMQESQLACKVTSSRALEPQSPIETPTISPQEKAAAVPAGG